MPNHVKNIVSLLNASDEQFERIRQFVRSEEYEFDLNRIIPMPEELKLPEGSSNDVFKNFYLKYWHVAIGMIPAEYFESWEGRGALDILATVVDKAELDVLERSLYSRFGKEGNPEPACSFVTPFEQKTDCTLIKDALQLGWMYFENRRRFGHETWYSWRISNWGTKWNTYDDTVSESGHSFEFSTAWNAPRPVIERLHSLFPNVAIMLQYADEDLGSNCGVVKYENGRSFDIFPGELDNDEDCLRFACRIWDRDFEETKRELAELENDDDYDD